MKKFNYFFEIFLSPFLFLVIPFVFIVSIKNYFKGKGFKYMGFDRMSSLNNFFYKTQKLNLDNYNKNKETPLLGFGNYHMSKLFYIPRISHNLFINLGPAFTTILFSFLNIGICIIFYDGSNLIWLLMVIFLGYFSVINYSASFTSQNYNFVAWFFFPVFIFSLLNSEIYLLLISSICIFVFSFSVGLYLILFSIFYIFSIKLSYFYLLPLFVFLILIYVYPLIISGLLIRWVLETFLFVGLSKKNNYSRSHQKFSNFNIYYGFLFLLPIVINFFGKNNYDFLIFFSYIIFIINQFFFRFMDRENPIYAFLICNIILTILNPEFINIISLILIANPIASSLNISYKGSNKTKLKVRIFEPFKDDKLIKKIKIFTKKVPKNRAILFAYNNPKKNYDNIFDGYRYVVEVIYYYFQLRRVRAFPDWYSVWEENKNKKIIWGRKIKKIVLNLKKLNSKYVVYHTRNKNIIDKDIKRNFKRIGYLSIDKNYKYSNPLWLKKNKRIYFYLLEKK